MLLELKDVKTVFKTDKREVTSVDRVSLRLEKGDDRHRWRIGLW